MKVLKFFLIYGLLLGLSVAAWIYYPTFQITKIKNESIEVGSVMNKETYLDYFRKSADQDLYHLAIGDSIIHGFGASETENLVYKFSNQLGEELNKTVHYSNEGVNGLTSTKLNQLVQKGHFDEVIKKSDIITINVGGNDILKTVRRKDFYDAFASFDTVQSTFIKNLTEISEKIEKINPDATIVLLELYNPLPVDHQFYAMANGLLPKWNVKIYEIAQAIHSSIVVQTTNVINSNNSQNLAADGIHPNPNGYSAITKQMIEQFAREYRRQAV